MQGLTFPPSAAEVWANCPGSRQMQRSYRDPKSDARLEGDAADELLSLCISSGVMVPEMHIGSEMSNGVVVDAEMAEAVSEATGFIVPIVSDPQTRYVKTKAKVVINGLGHPQQAEIDVAIRWRDTVFIIDYKHGHSFVPAIGNKQLLCYMQGVHEAQPDVKNFVGVIVQPRHFGSESVRRWDVEASQLPLLVAPLAQAVQVANSNPMAPIVVGPHCKRCHSLATCPAAKEAAFVAVDSVSDLAHEDEVPPEFLGAFHTRLKRSVEILDQKLQAVSGLIEHKLKNGTPVEGKRLHRKYTPLKWDANASIETLEAMCGVELHKQTPLTPTQAIKAGVSEDLVKSMARRHEASLTVVDDDGSIAEEVFGK